MTEPRWRGAAVAAIRKIQPSVMHRWIRRGDEEVWPATEAEDRVLVTQDLDFSDTRKFEPGSTRAGVRIVRLITERGYAREQDLEAKLSLVLRDVGHETK